MPKVNQELAIQILQVIQLIPYGKVACYGQIAKMAGLPKHARMVGYVLKHLDSSSDIPWHRVINAQGQLSLNDLDEYGLNRQQQKLLEEGIAVVAGRVNLKRYQWLGE
ncbi:MGMT family protein [Acinetobacter tianfuensis]|uniref:MGMT family protein n=1 Tax=Acinetobacter tianfuensis TaxID=2419603 RepID=A0A3A8EEQ1_9GAMM|nr:MGMT family protein [Acinetobacter tianfuensis]RKG29320.1 MGMT family protein [Acinetobacter tianfuensis]